jgi:starvation-inducible DNA-binding protein
MRTGMSLDLIFVAVHEMLDPQIDQVREAVGAAAKRIAALGG